MWFRGCAMSVVLAVVGVPALPWPMAAPLSLSGRTRSTASRPIPTPARPMVNRFPSLGFNAVLAVVAAILASILAAFETLLEHVAERQRRRAGRKQRQRVRMSR